MIEAGVGALLAGSIDGEIGTSTRHYRELVAGIFDATLACAPNRTPNYVDQFGGLADEIAVIADNVGKLRERTSPPLQEGNKMRAAGAPGSSEMAQSECMMSLRFPMIARRFDHCGDLGEARRVMF